jgi:C1A family cysteine protease
MQHKMGLKSLHDPNKHKFGVFLPKDVPTNLPPSVDYTNFAPPVQDQGEIGSCVSWGNAKLLELYHRKIHNVETLVSARAIYSSAKHQFQPQDLTDDGLNVSDGLNIIKQFYVLESDYPSSDNKSNQFHEWIAIVPANIHKTDYLIKDFESVPSDVQSLKQALFERGPAVIGINFANEWEDCDNTGRLQSTGLTSAGGHCMMVVGYDDNFVNLDNTKGAFKISNSWGENYGDKGYIYLPYNVNKEFFFSDIYTVSAN